MLKTNKKKKGGFFLHSGSSLYYYYYYRPLHPCGGSFAVMSVDRPVVIVGVANLRNEWGCRDDEGGGSGLARLIRNISIKFVFIFLFYTLLSFIRIIRILEIFFCICMYFVSRHSVRSTVIL